MSDPTDTAMSGFTTVSKSMQSITSEIQKMSKDSMDQASQHMEKLRGAKSMEEVISIQTGFMQQSFTTYADYTKRLSEMMMTLPMELAKQGQTAFQQGKDAMTKATEQAGEQFKQATDQHHG